MAQNSKTRLFFSDALGGAPYSINGVVEFDVYQEAYDYARAVIRNTAGFVVGSTESMTVFLYRY